MVQPISIRECVLTADKILEAHQPVMAVVVLTAFGIVARIKLDPVSRTLGFGFDCDQLFSYFPAPSHPTKRRVLLLGVRMHRTLTGACTLTLCQFTRCRAPGRTGHFVRLRHQAAGRHGVAATDARTATSTSVLSIFIHL